jgi:activator of 2-hydroxyglutaryl-CoA dehydratase
VNATAGIDIGSTYTKAALVDDNGELLGTGISPTGFRLEAAAQAALTQARRRRASTPMTSCTWRAPATAATRSRSATSR